MPGFVRVGPHRGTTSGHTARGWQATRKGTRVRVCWGPIEITQQALGKTKYVWFKRAKLPRSIVYRCSSETAARRKYAELKALKMKDAQDHHGYRPLPTGTRIRTTRPRAK